MGGAWETQKTCMVGILHTENVTMAWSLGLRNLMVPGPIVPVAGMPYDMARNRLCMMALESNADFCFVGTTKVETIDGMKSIRDIQIGDLVRTHSGAIQPVTHVFQRDYKQKSPLLEIHTEYGKIRCTPEHPFLVSRPGEPRAFVPASKLTEEDYLLYPDRYQEDWINFDIRYNTSKEQSGKLGSIKNGSFLGRIPVTRDIARFLGLFLAEGCVCSSGIHMTFGNHETELIDFVGRMSRLLFDRKPTVIRRWATTVTINIRSLGKRFAEWFGRGARNVRIPPFVFGWSLENKLSFLVGYLDGDGSDATHAYSTFTTASKNLTDDVRRLAGSCGMDVHYYEAPANVAVMKSGQEIHGGVSWHGHFPRSSSAKMESLLAATRDGDYLKMGIRSIQRKRMSSMTNPQRQKVYNLEVAGDNSYIAESYAVHNCMHLDSDVIPPKDAILRLMRHNLPIVSGVYHRRSNPAGIPVMMKPVGQWVIDYPKNALIEVDVVGAGMLLIRRDVLEDLQPVMPGKHWFYWGVDMQGLLPQEKCLSEDFVFCREVNKQLGHKIMVDTSVQCLHVGYSEVTHRNMAPMECRPMT